MVTNTVNFGSILLKLLTTVIFIVIFPILFLIFIAPFHIIRRVIEFLMKLYNPDLLRLVSTRSSVWTADPIHQSPETNITIIAIFDKKIDYNQLCSNFEANVSSKYPRLRQHFEVWLGYSFWKYDNCFRITDHLTTHSDSVIGQDQLHLLANHINRRAFSVNQSPWCGVLVENFCTHPQQQSITSAWIFNIHHSLTDAFGAQCLLNTLVGNSNGPKQPLNDVTIPLPFESSQTSFFQKVFQIHAFANELVTLKDENQLRRFGFQASKDREIEYFTNPLAIPDGQLSIPFAHVQQIQDKYSVSVTAIMGTLAAGCLERICTELNTTLPEYVHLMFPYSHPGHTKEVTNHQSFVFLRVPLASKSAVERLKLIDADVRRQRNAGLSKIYAKLVPLVLGPLPVTLTKYLYKVDLPSGMMISISIDEPITFQGTSVTDISFISGPLPGDQGIYFFFMRYGEKFKFGMALSTTFTKKVKMVSLLQQMADEANKLRET